MARPTVVVSSVVVGCLAFVLAARFYADADAPPPRAPAANAARDFRPTPPAAAVPEVIRLPQQVIRASAPARRRIRAPARRPRSRAPDVGWPCSPWRALGPVYAVHAGDKPRQRHVRLLCFGPRPRARHAER